MLRQNSLKGSYFEMKTPDSSENLLDSNGTKSLLIISVMGGTPASNFEFENVDLLFSQQKTFINDLVDEMQLHSVDVISIVRLSNTKILVSFDSSVTRAMVDDCLSDLSLFSSSRLSITYDYFELHKTLSNDVLDFISSCVNETNQSRIYELLDMFQNGDTFFSKKELERAFSKNEFVAHVQSIVDLTTGKARSLEVLCRWQHPDLGLLFPGAFLPSILANGKELEFDTYMLKTVKEMMFSTSLPLSLNINCSSLQSEQFVKSIIEFVTNSSIGNRLKLELTELASIGDHSVCHTNITKLQTNGVYISLDDFGSGLTNLNYLTYLKPDEIKLDKVLLDAALGNDLMHSSLAKQMIRSIVQWVESMPNVQLVVEGIERDDQRAFLVKSGVAVGQGFIYGKPCHIEDFSLIE
ncbi:EAL domain-containing protein [Vibrio jasicida]|uniref:EAL domain-containing protein n=3 Tax=Vibrionaceae TaxID=641 RepID=A0AAU9QT78_9VIBR|nr:hypothetical protein CKJ79_16855 [Vibrio coralliilyticus]POB47063.1 EAL domain-containing protein [Vibrio vulnificus]CAH1589443.1 EAL domain-containing protein [Vibrio jasicida]CAH1599569.1 EAL domain-containing protein [Vibrio jasicida]